MGERAREKEREGACKRDPEKSRNSARFASSRLVLVLSLCIWGLSSRRWQLTRQISEQPLPASLPQLAVTATATATAPADRFADFVMINVNFSMRPANKTC